MTNWPAVSRTSISARRGILLVTTATLGLCGASVAHAQDAAGFAPELEAQAERPTVTLTTPQIVIGYPGTPTTALDPVDVNGVGQMIVDIGGGFIGLCTASLINPRTVIFAAHCVNEEAATDYGDATGGTPIGFGFSNDTFAGLIDWYFSAPGEHGSNPDLYFYNGNYVAYHPGSLDPAAAGFLFSDIAVASLDTPAANVPTWALLFSPLPPVDVDANGTGYHVTITGYGRNGTGSTGSTGGIDFRRRSADNMLGALASLDDFEGFLFGSLPGLYPQNLYWIDFDDPRRRTPSASPFDFNAWRDNPQPTEGITASGDSGGPLILDQTFGIDVIIGTLSGGYTRFFMGQPPNGYGTASFYQPLYLYWDWIAGNNPYHYVGAMAGDDNWSDPTHWQTELDPNYMVIDAGGNLVNGIPDSPGGGTADPSGKFGEVCFEGFGIAVCQDFFTGEITIEIRPIGTGGAEDVGTAQSLPATVAAGTLSADDLETGAAIVSFGGPSGQAAGTASASPAALPAATLANGLPGATGFVPNNYGGDRLSGTAPRYFDVTLSATGTTTLDSAVTIDRFAIAGAGAALDITSTGSLTSLIDINQYQGMMRVNGTLTTGGDYLLMTGGLQGSGTINTPFFTNVAGAIAPGGIGATGTLTFNGNVILSNGSTYLIDLGVSGSSDLIQVFGTGSDGVASLGGNLMFGAAGGTMIRDGYAYTILTAQGGITDTFNTPSSISAILTPTLAYTANSVLLEIEAGSYADVVDPSSPVQPAYAQLLDQNRAAYGSFADLYGPLDLQDAATIRATLQGMAPRAQVLGGALGLAAVDALAQLNRERLAGFDPNKSGGTLTMIGRPLELASLAVRGGSNVGADASEMLVDDGALPSNMNAYLASGYIDGDAAPMTGFSGRSQFDGWFVAAGLEIDVGSNAMLGISGAYSDLDGAVSGAPQAAGGKLYQATLYGKVETPGKLMIDGQFTAGALSTDTTRVVGFPSGTFSLETDDSANVYAGEFGLSKEIGAGPVTITPRAALRASAIHYGTTAESGGPMALVYAIGTYKSVQGRAGAMLEFGKGAVKPHLTATYVHDFEDRPAVFGANFAGGVGPTAPFPLTGTDQDWGEVSGGLTYSTGNVDLSVAAQTTLWRSDVSMQNYRGSVTVHF